MDPIANLLIIIKNAQMAGKKIAEAHFSNVKFELAKILEKEGYLGKVERKGIKPKEKIILNLKYNQGVPAIQDLRRMSKPSQRRYIQADKIRLVKQGYGTSVVSTSQGLMTGKEARKKRLGGEFICEIW